MSTKSWWHIIAVDESDARRTSKWGLWDSSNIQEPPGCSLAALDIVRSSKMAEGWIEGTWKRWFEHQLAAVPEYWILMAHCRCTGFCPFCGQKAPATSRNANDKSSLISAVQRFIQYSTMTSCKTDFKAPFSSQTKTEQPQRSGSRHVLVCKHLLSCIRSNLRQNLDLKRLTGFLARHCHGPVVVMFDAELGRLWSKELFLWEELHYESYCAALTIEFHPT